MKKVLIYGFGWAGKSCLLLCEHLNVDVNIVDDNEEFSEFDMYFKG